MRLIPRYHFHEAYRLDLIGQSTKEMLQWPRFSKAAKRSTFLQCEHCISRQSVRKPVDSTDCLIQGHLTTRQFQIVVLVIRDSCRGQDGHSFHSLASVQLTQQVSSFYEVLEAKVSSLCYTVLLYTNKCNRKASSSCLPHLLKTSRLLLIHIFPLFHDWFTYSFYLLSSVKVSAISKQII